MLIFAVLITAPLLAQPGAMFEAASIKVGPAPEPSRGFSAHFHGGPGTDDPSLYTCSNCPLSILLQKAFALPAYLIVGIEPIGDHLYQLTARLDPGATHEQFLAMLRNLLVERFKLEVHRESRQIPAYELTIARNGSKLKPTRFADSRGTRLSFDPGKMTYHAEATSIDRLIQTISSGLHAPVVDATGLKDRYDFELVWDGSTPNRPALSADAADPNTSDTQLTIFGALQSQLGLRLEQKKAPFEVLVVDRFEKIPIEN